MWPGMGVARVGVRLGAAQERELAGERKTFEYVMVTIRIDPCTYMLHTGSCSTTDFITMEIQHYKR